MALFTLVPSVSAKGKKAKIVKAQFEVTRSHRNDMLRYSDGRGPEQEVTSDTVQIAVGEMGNGFSLKKLTRKGCVIDTHIRHMNLDTRETGTEFRMKRGETLRLMMCDVTDVTIKLTVKMLP